MKKTFSVITCALCTLLVLPAAAQVPAYVPTDGLVGWWPFNGNANDESGNGNDGVVNGATLTEDRFGNANAAYGFDGVDDFIEVADDSLLDFGVNPQFSISLWFKINSLSPGGLFSKAETSFLDPNITGWNWRGINYYFENGTAYIQCSAPCSGNLSYTSNTEFRQLVMTVQDGTIKIYINLTLVSEFQCPNIITTSVSNNLPLLLGLDRDQYSHLLGSLDDIAIYNRALTEQEIQNLYTGTTPQPCVSLPSNLQQGLVGYWPFCGNANDESGNGNDGVVNGATLTEDRFGNANAAYGFDGVDDFIEVANSTSNTITGDMTMSAWIKTLGSNNQNYQTVISKRETYWTWEYSMALSFHDGIIHNTKALASRALGMGNQEQAWSVTPYEINSWELWTVTFSEGGVKLYKNGELDYSAPFSLVPNAQNSPLLFGRNTLVDNSEQYYGSLDDIGIWNRALTPEEVQELYTLDACTFTVYDTLTVENLINVYDTITFENFVDVYDTTYFNVEVYDTLTIENIVNVYDTITIENFVDVYDTTYFNVEVYDTLTVENLINVYDTITIENFVDVYDTTIVVENVLVYDTLTVENIVNVYDTITIENFVDVYDTTYITVTDTLLIDITFVGFEGQPSWLNTVTVFPNPASDHITIDYGNFALMAGYNTVITDAAGATVYSSAVNSQQVSIDINAWGAAGVYYMSIYDANGALVAVRHIVLQ